MIGAYCSNGKIISIDINPPQIILLNKTEKRQSLIYKQQLEAVGRQDYYYYYMYVL